MWTYGGTFPGLEIRRPTGQTTHVTFTNNLPAMAGGMTVHHHGNHTLSADDGQATGANYLFGPGTSRTYTYEGKENGGNERGAMQFYHDHRMGETGFNVWQGLSGLYIIDDPADPATPPSGAYEMPLVFVDRQFDADNQLEYFYDPFGVVGDKVLVNGVYQPYMEVADRKYRLRFLNGANARITLQRLYCMFWLDGMDTFPAVASIPATISPRKVKVDGKNSGSRRPAKMTPFQENEFPGRKVPVTMSVPLPLCVELGVKSPTMRMTGKVSAWSVENDGQAVTPE
jgi:FtsP/CotA-like multicopper oxidase with cupredoxin domain